MTEEINAMSERVKDSTCMADRGLSGLFGILKNNGNQLCLKREVFRYSTSV